MLSLSFRRAWFRSYLANLKQYLFPGIGVSPPLLLLCSMKRILFFFLLVLAAYTLRAQDPVFSQLFNNRVFLNPSFAGMDPGVRVGMVHRNLWRSVSPKNFYTSGVSVDVQPCRFPTMGLGMIFASDTEGDGRYTVNNLGLIYSYKLLLGRRSTLSMALQGDYYSAYIDWSQFIFSDQLDPVLGVVRPSSNYNASVENANYFDFSSALVFRNSWRLSSREIFWHIGSSFHHLPLGFNQAFLGNASLPLRVTVHGGWLIPVFKTGNRLSYHVMPFFRVTGQDFRMGRHRSTDLGIMLVNKWLQGGVAYKMNPVNLYVKNTDAVSFSMGVTGDFSPGVSYRFSYSYDFNYKGASNGTLGTHEITFITAFKNTCRQTRNSIHKKDCFDYGKKGLESIF
jgi:type IX secretion system PorP/SprF family membrane protein